MDGVDIERIRSSGSGGGFESAGSMLGEDSILLPTYTIVIYRHLPSTIVIYRLLLSIGTLFTVKNDKQRHLIDKLYLKNDKQIVNETKLDK